MEVLKLEVSATAPESPGLNGPAAPVASRFPAWESDAAPSASLPPTSGPRAELPVYGNDSQLAILQTQMRALQNSMARLAPQPSGSSLDDPFATCVMSPYEADPVPDQYLVDDMQDSLPLLSAPPSRDPFQGLDLSGFSLSAVGAAVGSRSADAPESKEAALWSLVRAGDGTRPRKIPKDQIERLNKTDSGVFVMPTPVPEVQTTRTPSDPLPRCPTTEVGGRLSLFSPRLEAIEASSSVLRLVLGVHLECNAAPRLMHAAQAPDSATGVTLSKCALLQQELSALLHK